MEEKEKTKVSPKKITMILVIVLIIILATGSGAYYFLFAEKQDASLQEMMAHGNANGRDMGNLVTSTGVTVIGIDSQEFDVAELDTELEIEEVYLSSGDVVEKDTPILKLTDECVEDARKELTDELTTADLNYRKEVIAYQNAVIVAQYTYDSTVLEADQAEAVYNEAIAKEDRTLADAQKKVDDSLEDVAAYTKQVENFSDYNTSGANEYENQYDALQDLFDELCDAWGYSHGSIPTQKSFADAQKINGDDKYKTLVKLKTLIYTTDETFVDKYQESIDSKTDAEAALVTEQAALVDYQAALEKAQADYQTNCLAAKQTYDMALAKKDQAKSDYDTAVKKAQDALDTAQDAKDDTQDDLADFEASVGDGTLYTKGAGEIIMLTVEAGDELTDGTVVLAFADTETMTVSVSVAQADIAKIYVGEEALVSISDQGTFDGAITEINPDSNSDSRTNITYAVEVTLSGDVSKLTANQTAQVVFGMTSDDRMQEPGGQASEAEQEGGITDETTSH
ncbi:MAG: efflux RND transporter periplasmic adaptor subunit [Lachnospiraceae bacterium]|nr:efflux RND transporter periplasmic adaptor subunit [Lachnospiraceae bacterium]